MLTKKQWILAPALILASVVTMGTQEAKADVRVSPWGGISISFGTPRSSCRPSYNSFFGSRMIHRHYSPPLRYNSYSRYGVHRHTPSIRSRSHSNCNPRYRR